MNKYLISVIEGEIILECVIQGLDPFNYDNLTVNIFT